MSNENVLEAVELAASTGKVRRGTNEVTKSVERGEAKLVALAEDVDPKEIIMHIPILSKEKGVPCFTAGSKEELGAAAGLGVATVAVAVVNAGEAKESIKDLGGKADDKPAKEAKEEDKPEEADKESSE